MGVFGDKRQDRGDVICFNPRTLVEHSVCMPQVIVMVFMTNHQRWGPVVGDRIERWVRSVNGITTPIPQAHEYSSSS